MPYVRGSIAFCSASSESGRYVWLLIEGANPCNVMKLVTSCWLPINYGYSTWQETVIKTLFIDSELFSISVYQHMHTNHHLLVTFDLLIISSFHRLTETSLSYPTLPSLSPWPCSTLSRRREGAWLTPQLPTQTRDYRRHSLCSLQ